MSRVPAWRAMLTVGGMGADYPVSLYNNVALAMQPAIEAGFARSGGDVVLQNGTWSLPNPGNIVTPRSRVTIYGESRDGTILQTARTDYIFKNLINTFVTDFWIKNLTIDCQNLTDVSALQLLNATNTGCENVKFINSAKWFAKIGSELSASSPDFCFGCKFINCEFDTHSSIYEALLIYNAKNTMVQKCTFSDNADNSPCVGIWQKSDNTQIRDCTFNDCIEKAIYYGMTCHNTRIEENTFNNCGTGIQGGNVPDNGLFSETFAKGLHINGNRFIGGSNSTTAVAAQFGGVDGCFARDNYIEGYERGFLFGYGNATGELTAEFASKNGRIADNTFKNLNPNGDVLALHNAFVFTNGAGNGMQFVNNAHTDDQAVKTLKHGVSFSTAGATYSNMQFTGNTFQLQVGGSTSVTNNGATVDGTVVFS